MRSSVVLLKQIVLRSPCARILSFCIACASIGLSASAQAEMFVTDDPEVLKLAEKYPYNWVPKYDLPTFLRDEVPPGCNGLYIESSKALEEIKTSKSLAETELVVEAEDASIVDGNTATLKGNVSVSHGSRSISAGSMSYDRAADKAVLEKDVKIRQPGMQIDGQYAEISTTDHRGEFNDATFVMKERQMRGGAGSVRQENEYLLSLTNGSMTTCEPGDESWVLEGEYLSVNRETNMATGKNVKLKLGGVPVFYLPYITFPIGDQRKTGFLFPSIRSSDDGGLDMSFPYYWNLAPNYDATLTPRFISGRGTMLEAESRYLNEWLYADGGIAILPDDEGSQDPDLQTAIDEGAITEADAHPHRGSNRWLVQFNQNSKSTQGWYTRTAFTRVSDVDYFRDLGSASFAVNNTTFLNQELEVGYQFDHWRLASLAQTQQVLLLDLDAPYRKMPQVDLVGRYHLNGWVASLENRYTNFNHRDASFRPDIVTGQRFNTTYNLRWEKRTPWGFAIPQIGYRSLTYLLDDNPLFSDETDEAFTIGTPQASLDLGLVFEHSSGPFTQTLEPRAFYLYRRYQEHDKLFNLGGVDGPDINFDTSERTFSYGQLYRDSRFIGGDRLDDANQVTLGLSTRWHNNATGKELFNISAGQILHFKDRRVSLLDGMADDDTVDSSEFAGELKVHLIERTQVYANAIYDKENGKINRGSTGVNFASRDYQKLLNISYSFLRDKNAVDNPEIVSRDIDQVDVSFTHPVSSQWAVMGRANYDFQNKQELEAFLGFEYNDCCYRLRFLARRWLDSNIANLAIDESAKYDQGVFFEITFKGLGNPDGKATDILNDGIFGYETRENYIH